MSGVPSGLLQYRSLFYISSFFGYMSGLATTFFLSNKLRESKPYFSLSLKAALVFSVVSIPLFLTNLDYVENDTSILTFSVMGGLVAGIYLAFQTLKKDAWWVSFLFPYALIALIFFFGFGQILVRMLLLPFFVPELSPGILGTVTVLIPEALLRVFTLFKYIIAGSLIDFISCVIAACFINRKEERTVTA